MDMRQLTSILFFLLLMCGTAQAEAQSDAHSGLYLGAYFGIPSLGTNSATDDLGRFNLKTDAGKLYALTLGYDLPAGGGLGEGRVELAYSQSSNNITQAEFTNGQFAADGEMKRRSLLLSSYMVFRNRSRLLPYLGVGLGAAQIRVDKLRVSGSPLIDDESIVFAWQGGCGVTVELSSRLRLDLGYRYVASVHPEITEVDGRSVKLDLNAHTGLLGLVYKF